MKVSERSQICFTYLKLFVSLMTGRKFKCIFYGMNPSAVVARLLPQIRQEFAHEHVAVRGRPGCS